MTDKRYRLILRDDQKRIASALWEREKPQDEFCMPPTQRSELPDAAGETIRSVKPFGIYFDRYTTSYEFEIDGPVLFVMESGHMYLLFGDSFRRCRARDIAGINLKYNNIPAAMRFALDALCGHTILDLCREDGVLTITLDGRITIESWDGFMREYSEISLLQRLR